MICLTLTLQVYAQEHIAWQAEYDVTSQKVIIAASLEAGWHVYSQTTDEFSGPVATKFELAINKNLGVESAMEEPEPIVAFDTNFEAEVKYFEKQVQFTQRLIAVQNTKAEYTITYMICNEVMCLPPVDKFISVEITK